MASVRENAQWMTSLILAVSIPITSCKTLTILFSCCRGNIDPHDACLSRPWSGLDAVCVTMVVAGDAGRT